MSLPLETLPESEGGVLETPPESEGGVTGEREVEILGNTEVRLDPGDTVAGETVVGVVMTS
jgi:hypothetical protein